jgi:hypothetical protein
MADVIGRGYYGGALKNAFGLTSRSQFVLASDIVPVVQVADTTLPPWMAQRTFSFFQQTPGVAAQFSAVGLGFLTGRKQLAVLRRLRCSVNATSDIQLTTFQPGSPFPGSAGVAGGAWDLRDTSGNPLFVSSHNAGAITGALRAAAVGLAASTPVEFADDVPWVIAEECSIGIWAATVNVTLNVWAAGDLFDL